MRERRTKVLAITAMVAVGAFLLDRAADADRVIDAALEFSRGRSEPREQATCLASVWSALVSLKRTEQADSVLSEARTIAAAIASDESRGYALLNMAQKCAAAGRKSQADELLVQAQAAADKVSDASARGPLEDDIARARKSL